MTDAALGYGTQIRVGVNTAATTATVLLAGAKEIPAPPFTRDLQDITNMSSPNGYREFLPGMKDGGELSLTLIWYPGGPTDLIIEAMKSETAARVFEVKFTQVTPNRAFTFSAFLTGAEPAVPVDGAMEMSITLKITGNVVAA